MRDFDGRLVVVTGGSRGLGRAIAQELARRGAVVGVGYRSGEEDARAVVSAIEGVGGQAFLFRADVASAPEVAAAFEEVRRTRGAVDVLVNNAGIANDEVFALGTAASFDEVVATDLLGVVNPCRAVIRSMLARGRGSIVNVSSVAAIRASRGKTSYAAAKGGVLAFTRSLAVEVAPKGVRVNAVIPGMLDTGIAARLDPRVIEEHRRQVPLGRVGTGDEVARAVAFLASDAASYIVGAELMVDGGLAL